VERTASELPLGLQADLLSLSRSSLYYQPRPPSAEEVRLKHRIDEVYMQYPFYGSRKIAAQLQREGMGINRKTVTRYMREMGIAAIYPGPNLSKQKQKEGVYQALTRYFEFYNYERPHQALDYQSQTFVYFRKARATSDERVC